MATILVLNGDESTAALLVEFFEWQRHRTIHARSVSEARQWIDRGLVDLMVTERVVPWPDGECVPTALCPACRRAGVPMLVWTADVLEEERACIVAARAHYLPKPSSLDDISDAVELLLRSRRPALT